MRKLIVNGVEYKTPGIDIEIVVPQEGGGERVVFSTLLGRPKGSSKVVAKVAAAADPRRGERVAKLADAYGRITENFSVTLPSGETRYSGGDGTDDSVPSVFDPLGKGVILPSHMWGDLPRVDENATSRGAVEFFSLFGERIDSPSEPDGGETVCGF